MSLENLLFERGRLEAEVKWAQDRIELYIADCQRCGVPPDSSSPVYRDISSELERSRAKLRDVNSRIADINDPSRETRRQEYEREEKRRKIIEEDRQEQERLRKEQEKIQHLRYEYETLKKEQDRLENIELPKVRDNSLLPQILEAIAIRNLLIKVKPKIEDIRR